MKTRILSLLLISVLLLSALLTVTVIPAAAEVVETLEGLIRAGKI